MSSFRPSVLRLQAALGLALGIGSLACGAEVPICESPEDLGDGLERCDDGLVRRTKATTCASSVPRADTCEADPDADACASDADCTERAHGFCRPGGGFDGPSACACVYGCTTDQDCGDGAFCRCSDPVGYCETASCRTNADCGEELSCAEYSTECGGSAFACQTSDDTCAVAADCGEGLACAYDGKKRDCVEQDPCAAGRPFLVEGAARTAPAVVRADWGGGLDLEGLRLDHLDVWTRRALAARWTAIGLMEHASVAAFARFALELCGQGAPSHLVDETQRALADELRHTRIAFALASCFSGGDLGPGPLPLHGVRIETSPELMLRTLFREGCVGETVAALEAGAGSAQALDPVVRSVLASIERDEGDHAALAWKAAAWLLDRLGEGGRQVVREEWARTRAGDTDASAPEDEVDLTAHGLPTKRERAALRRVALAQVVAPAVAHLLSTGRAAADAETASPSC